ncbi:hypothetical protein ACC719_11400 [Rhizobium ruizarguesonis]
MINTDAPDDDKRVHDKKVDDIVAGGPNGAILVAGIATAVVISMWFLFYLFVFLPRGAMP